MAALYPFPGYVTQRVAKPFSFSPQIKRYVNFTPPPYAEYQFVMRFVGYGHYKLSLVNKNGYERTVITGNTDLIQRLSSEVEQERKEATDEAIALIIASQKQSQ